MTLTFFPPLAEGIRVRGQHGGRVLKAAVLRSKPLPRAILEWVMAAEAPLAAADDLETVRLVRFAMGEEVTVAHRRAARPLPVFAEPRPDLCPAVVADGTVTSKHTSPHNPSSPASSNMSTTVPYNSAEITLFAS
jgi:hypothetical protein